MRPLEGIDHVRELDRPDQVVERIVRITGVGHTAASSTRAGEALLGHCQQAARESSLICRAGWHQFIA
jgi:hypothetical protein